VWRLGGNTPALALHTDRTHTQTDRQTALILNNYITLVISLNLLLILLTRYMLHFGTTDT